jgi:hypothetical protein
MRFDIERPRDALYRCRINGQLPEYPADNILRRRIEIFEIGYTLGKRGLRLQTGFG